MAADDMKLHRDDSMRKRGVCLWLERSCSLYILTLNSLDCSYYKPCAVTSACVCSTNLLYGWLQDCVTFPPKHAQESKSPSIPALCPLSIPSPWQESKWGKVLINIQIYLKLRMKASHLIVLLVLFNCSNTTYTCNCRALAVSAASSASQTMSSLDRNRFVRTQATARVRKSDDRLVFNDEDDLL